MDKPIEEPIPRMTLDRGEVALGQVAVGPNGYWRVPLDTATMCWEAQIIVITGLETGICCEGNTVIECVGEFWRKFVDFASALEAGAVDLRWLPDTDKREMYAGVMADRFLAAIATPPSDGDPYELRGEFWDGKCPREKNPYQKILSYPPF